MDKLNTKFWPLMIKTCSFSIVIFALVPLGFNLYASTSGSSIPESLIGLSFAKNPNFGILRFSMKLIISVNLDPNSTLMLARLLSRSITLKNLAKYAKNVDDPEKAAVAEAAKAAAPWLSLRLEPPRLLVFGSFLLLILAFQLSL